MKSLVALLAAIVLSDCQSRANLVKVAERVYKAETDFALAAEQRGIFHAVWRVQPNGSWKYVWD